MVGADLSFITRGKIEPLECATASLRKQWWYDCQNSELTGAQLVVTKIRAEIDARFGAPAAAAASHAASQSPETLRSSAVV